MASLQPQLMSVQDLFRDSIFSIPDYQRAYAWEKKQWSDLWDDISEGIRTGTSHFLGTVVLMADDEPIYDGEQRRLRQFHVVDGQQRMTSLCLVLLALYRSVRAADEKVANGIWRDFVEPDQSLHRLRPGRLNAAYFSQMVDALRTGTPLPAAERSTNKRLRDATLFFEASIAAWLEQKDATPLALASFIRSELQMLRFVTDSRPLAIKTFQTVNDRGKLLSLMEKTKSFLMFYVTRYMEDDLEVFHGVEEAFGRVFDNYDTIRDLAALWNVSYFLRPQFKFDEDEFLRYAYHYGARGYRARFHLEDTYEYDITPERIFNQFMKNACQKLRDDAGALRSFILEWCGDLVTVSESLVAMLKRIPEYGQYARFFRFQGPSASIYPLLVGAQARGILDEAMLHAISILDLRVYKVRNTDPKADLYRRAVSRMKTGDRNAIYEAIVDFSRWFGGDSEIDIALRGPVYRAAHTKFVLWKHAVSNDGDIDELDYELFASTEQEHVHPGDSSKFDVTSVGFISAEDYEATKNGYGNLILLEQPLNRRASNVPPSAKGPIYMESRLAVNRLLGSRINQAAFRKAEQAKRLDEIVAFFKATWPVPDYAAVASTGEGSSRA